MIVDAELKNVGFAPLYEEKNIVLAENVVGLNSLNDRTVVFYCNNVTIITWNTEYISITEATI